MKEKWIDYITQLTLLMLIFVVAFALSKIVELNNKINSQELIIKELQERTLNHEYRLENIMPNDDIL